VVEEEEKGATKHVKMIDNSTCGTTCEECRTEMDEDRLASVCASCALKTTVTASPPLLPAFINNPITTPDSVVVSSDTPKQK